MHHHVIWSLVAAFAWLGCVFITSAGAASPAATARRPWRVVELVTGEQCFAECLRLDKRAAEFRIDGMTRFRIPLAAIRAVRNPPGIVDVWDETASTKGNDPAIWSSAESASWERSCDAAVSAGELGFWRHVTGPTANSITGWISCRFGVEGDAPTLRLALQANGALDVVAPPTWRMTFQQPVASSGQWTKIRILWDSDRCNVLVGEAVRVTFAIDGGGLHQFRLERGEDGICRINDIGFRRCTSPTRAHFVHDSDDLDTVTLASGDQLFGQLTTADAGQIALRGADGTWSGKWTDVVRIDMAPRKTAANLLVPVRGWCVDTQTTPTAESHGERTSWRSLVRQGTLAQHPVLGVFPWPAAEIVQPIGFGEWRWLDAGWHRLGDELRANLFPVSPEGTAISGSWTSSTLPTGNATVVCDVAELEPSGPETPPTQPFLSVLRGGGLRTELLVNDRVISDVNRQLTHRPASDYPVRIRLNVSRAAMRPGVNTWAFHLRPMAANNPQCDDGYVGRVGLWTSLWPW